MSPLHWAQDTPSWNIPFCSGQNAVGGGALHKQGGAGTRTASDESCGDASAAQKADRRGGCESLPERSQKLEHVKASEFPFCFSCRRPGSRTGE